MANQQNQNNDPRPDRQNQEKDPQSGGNQQRGGGQQRGGNQPNKEQTGE